MNKMNKIIFSNKSVEEFFINIVGFKNVIDLKFLKFIIIVEMTVTNPEEITFIYNGVEYDATEYSHKHPGGFDFIENMKN